MGKTKAGHFIEHTSHNRNEKLSEEMEKEQQEEEEEEARGSPGNKTFSLCVYDACQITTMT